MIYYTSDTHFGHTNIIRFANRPYKNVEEMDEDIIARWNSKVKPGDLVYHLGDFSWRDHKKYRQRLNGALVLLIGNHDKGLHESYFAEVCRYKEIKDNKQKLVLFHYPIWSWNGMHHGTIHLHGHVHANPVPPNEQEDIGSALVGRRININLEFWDYEPKTIEEIKERYEL